MPAAVDFPDPDFTFQRSSWGGSVATLSGDLANIASGVRTQNATITEGQHGDTVDESIERTTDAHQRLDAQSDILAHAAKAFDEMKGAADDYERDAPSLAEVQAAEKDMQRARKRMQETESSADERTYRDAQKKLRDLRAKRAAAKRVQEEADKRIGANLKALIPGHKWDPEGGGGHSTPGAPIDDQVGHHVGHPAPPATHPSAAPPGAHTPSAAANDELAKLMAQAQRPTGQPVAMPQPQQQPTAAAAMPTTAAPGGGGSSSPFRDRDKGRRDEKSNPLDALGGAAAAAVTPSAASTSTAPPPATSGESRTGMQTAANVTGRSGGDAKVNLSAGDARNAASTASGTTPARGGGMPVSPAMGAPGGAGGAQKKATEKIVQSESEAQMHGINAVSAAVRGGTILRRDGESGAS